jgi:hypothetical protein
MNYESAAPTTHSATQTHASATQAHESTATQAHESQWSVIATNVNHGSEYIIYLMPTRAPLPSRPEWISATDPTSDWIATILREVESTHASASGAVRRCEFIDRMEEHAGSSVWFSLTTEYHSESFSRLSTLWRLQCSEYAAAQLCRSLVSLGNVSVKHSHDPLYPAGGYHGKHWDPSHCMKFHNNLPSEEATRNILRTIRNSEPLCAFLRSIGVPRIHAEGWREARNWTRSGRYNAQGVWMH